MHVTVQTTSELGRKLSIQIPEEKVKEKVASRLRALARDTRIDGFRPGKAPQSVVVQRYGAKVREEVLSDMVLASFQEAIKEQMLRPAGVPRIILPDATEEQGLVYDAEFDIYPELKLAPLDSLTVKNPVAEVTDQDLDAMVQRLREQRLTWQEVNRAAQSGDRVTINFEGNENGVNFTNGVTENAVFVLGSKQLLDDFEKQIEGNAAGAHIEFSMTFPADYGNADLAGKQAEFIVDLTKVEEPIVPELDEELVKSYGVENGDTEAFLRDVRDNMNRELERAIQIRRKNAAMDALYEANEFPLPAGLVNEEIDVLMEPYRQAAAKHNQPFDDEPVRAMFEKIARRRVTLGLILSEIIQQNAIRVDKDRVRTLVETIAQSFQSPDEAMQWYYAQPERLQEVEHRVLEDQAVDLVLAQATIVPESISFDELMRQNSAE